jgi:hypothetical protein
MTRHLVPLVLIALAPFTPLPASADPQPDAPPATADATRPGDDAPPAKASKSKKPKAAPKPWRLKAFTAVVSNSNINQDEYNTGSTGYIGGLGAGYNVDLPIGSLGLSYETARHSYTHTTTWDRTTHNAEASLEYRLGKALYLESAAEAALKDASDDGEIRDQYTLQQTVEYRFTPVYRLRVEGGQRIKDYDDDDRKDAHDPFIGLALDQRWRGGKRLEVGYRFDRNDTRDYRRTYRRSTFGAFYERDYGKRDTASVEVRYRLYGYPNRKVDTGDGWKNRHDRRWVLEYRWDRDLGNHLTMRADYVFENRRSNDTDRNFDDHVYTLSLIRRW